MLNDSLQVMQIDPWTAVFPAIALSTAVLGFNLLGDSLRNLLDPRIMSGMGPRAFRAATTGAIQRQ